MSKTPQFKIGDKVLFNYKWPSNVFAEYWSAEITGKGNRSWQITYDGIVVPENTEPGQVGPQYVKTSIVVPDMLTLRTPEVGDALKKLNWQYKSDAWNAKREAARLQKMAEVFDDLCTKYGSIVGDGKCDLAVSWVEELGYWQGQTGEQTHHGRLIEVDINTFIGSVRMSSGEIKSIAVSQLTVE